jgi:hypothetical protein
MSHEKKREGGQIGNEWVKIRIMKTAGVNIIAVRKKKKHLEEKKQGWQENKCKEMNRLIEQGDVGKM